MAKTVEQIDVRTKIADYLHERGVKKSWLAEKADISDTHLHFILKCERDLTEENLTKINEALETNFKA